MLIDLHAHSHLSKGCDLDPRLVLERAAAHGLDGVAFTETNTQDGCDELFALQPKSPVRIFVGLELITDRGQYLCFFPRPELAPEPVQMWGSNRERPWSAAECLPKLKSLGAALIASRPYDRELPHPAGDYILTLDCLCAIEGYNPRVRSSANDMAVEAAETLRLPCVGGSDARASLDEVGRGATLFRDEVTSQAALVEALTAGQFWSLMVGELPPLSRPGSGRSAARSGGRKSAHGKHRRRGRPHGRA